MQVGMAEKWEETKETTERQAKEKAKWENVSRPAEVYTPRKEVRRGVRGAESIAEGECFGG